MAKKVSKKSDKAEPKPDKDGEDATEKVVVYDPKKCETRVAQAKEYAAKFRALGKRMQAEGVESIEIGDRMVVSSFNHMRRFIRRANRILDDMNPEE